MFEELRISIGWRELLRRTVQRSMSDDVLSLSAQLAYYFFLAVFPALIFLVALASFIPLDDLIDGIVNRIAGFAPPDVVDIVRGQLQQIADGQHGGLLTFGVLLALWSSSAGMVAAIYALNKAYDIDEARPWWRVRLTAIGLTIALALFILASFALVLAGPALAERIAAMADLGDAFVLVWSIVQWPVIFALVATAIALLYYFGPDAEQEWVWLTVGSIAATALWLVFSVGFRVYLTRFGDFNETYGTIGGVMVALLWFYASGLAILIGAELNAELERSSPYGKHAGEKRPGEKRRIGRLARRLWEERQRKAAAGQPVTIRPVLPVAAAVRPRRSPALVVMGGLLAGLIEYLRGRRTRA